MTNKFTEEDLNLTLSNAEYAVEEHDVKELSRLAKVDIPELVAKMRAERERYSQLDRRLTRFWTMLERSGSGALKKRVRRITELEEENEYLRRAYSTMAEHVAHSSTNEHWRRQAKDVLNRLG